MRKSSQRKAINVYPEVKEKLNQLKRSSLKFALLENESELIDYLIEFYHNAKRGDPEPDPLTNAILVSRFIDALQSEEVQQLIEKKMIG
jgi:iron-sulfur cluster repair protein YtfE (RIC family)